MDAHNAKAPGRGEEVVSDPRAAAHAALIQLLVEKGIITMDEYKQKAVQALDLQQAQQRPPGRTAIN